MESMAELLETLPQDNLTENKFSLKSALLRARKFQTPLQSNTFLLGKWRQKYFELISSAMQYFVSLK